MKLTHPALTLDSEIAWMGTFNKLPVFLILHSYYVFRSVTAVTAFHVIGPNYEVKLQKRIRNVSKEYKAAYLHKDKTSEYVWKKIFWKGGIYFSVGLNLLLWSQDASSYENSFSRVASDEWTWKVWSHLVYCILSYVNDFEWIDHSHSPQSSLTLCYRGHSFHQDTEWVEHQCSWKVLELCRWIRNVVTGERCLISMKMVRSENDRSSIRLTWRGYLKKFLVTDALGS